MEKCRCKFCGQKAQQIVRTATHAWFGCPYCHQTWDIQVGDTRTDAGVTEELDQHPMKRPSLLRGSIIAVAAAALALSLRVLLRPALGDASPFLLFTPAVAIAAIYGGALPGAIATVLSTMLGSHYLLTATTEPVVEKWDRVILFVVVGSVITMSVSLVQRSRQQLAASLWREQKARAAAEAADRTKDDFLALVSHELRTPMSVVLGWLSVIRKHRTNENTFRSAIDALERNAQILSRLVDDVLDRSRIATGTLRVDRRLIKLSTVVEAAVNQMRTQIEAAGLCLSVSNPAEEILIFGDSIRLQQVLTNLISNAIKFTPSKGAVSIDVVRTDQAAQIVVSDTGVGITPEVLPHIFDAFRQGPDTLARSRQGLGLGLAIARYLIEQHQGTIGVASEGRNHGTTFTIRLPLGIPAESPSHIFEAFDDHTDRLFHSIH